MGEIIQFVIIAIMGFLGYGFSIQIKLDSDFLYSATKMILVGLISALFFGMLMLFASFDMWAVLGATTFGFLLGAYFEIDHSHKQRLNYASDADSTHDYYQPEDEAGEYYYEAEDLADSNYHEQEDTGHYYEEPEASLDDQGYNYEFEDYTEYSYEPENTDSDHYHEHRYS